MDESDDERHRVPTGTRKKEHKRVGKDRGYTMFGSDNSEDELVTASPVDMDRVRSPNAKLKKHSKPSFKFSSRKVKDTRDKDLKEKEKLDRHERKQIRRRQMIQSKKERRNKDNKNTSLKKSQPIFGVPLALAVSRSPSNDGVLLPALFRDCIDFIEENGLDSEGIYRVSGVKSKVHVLKDLYNNGKGSVEAIRRHDPNVIASLLKLFIRELSEPILTENLQSKFESASSIKMPSVRLQQIQVLIDELPASNRLILSWTILHMRHVIDKRSVNKMTLQNVSIVLSPTLRISHRLLYVLFTQFTVLFCGITIKPHPDSTANGGCRRATVADVEAELGSQETALSKLHQALITGDLKGDAEDEIWEIQRKVTELKRSLKSLKRSEAIMSESTAGTQRRRSSTQPNIILNKREVDESVSTRKKNISGDGPEVIKRKPTPPLYGDTLDGMCTSKQSAQHEVEEDKMLDLNPAITTPEPENRKDEEIEVEVDISNETLPNNISIQETDLDRDENHMAEHILKTESSDAELNCSPCPARMSPVTMTDRPPSLVLKPRAHTIHTTGVSPTEASLKSNNSPINTKEVDKGGNKDKLSVTADNTESISNAADETDVEEIDKELKLELLTLEFIEEELLAMGNELKQKQAAEKCEMDRLQTEIGDIRDVHSRLYNDSDSEQDDYYSSSDSDTTEQEQVDKLKNLCEEEVILLEMRENLRDKIIEERKQCLDVKVRIRLIQHRQQTVVI